ncbi:MAG TPA: c-type cytochrome [Bradyrhizobium sp.]|nr:c-type cytochrome [Bradyrhizobium sp.]
MRALSVTLALLGASTAALAQDIENGRRLSERWCVECHNIETASAKPGRVISFASIANRPDVSPDMIAAFLLLPHAAMPNPPLSRKDAQDITAFIMKMKK